MPIGEENKGYAYRIARKLRSLDFTVEICLDKTKVPAMFKRAEHRRAKFAIIIGENEVKEGKIVIKNLASQEQIEIKEEELIEKIYDIHDQIYDCDDGCVE